MNFSGIDIGTSSICGIVYNTVSKDIVSIAKINNTDMLSCNVLKFPTPNKEGGK